MQEIKQELPIYWASYLMNGDSSGLEDQEEKLINETLKQLGLTQNSEKLILLSPQHEALFLNSINYFKERPIIGNGVNSYRHICDWEKHIETNLGCSTHPHNIYFQEYNLV